MTEKERRQAAIRCTTRQLIELLIHYQQTPPVREAIVHELTRRDAELSKRSQAR